MLYSSIFICILVLYCTMLALFLLNADKLNAVGFGVGDRTNADKAEWKYLLILLYLNSCEVLPL